MKFEATDINDLSLPRAERDAAPRWLRNNDPVHGDAKNGFWLLTRYADVRRLANRIRTAVGDRAGLASSPALLPASRRVRSRVEAPWFASQ
jgi:cytochrome P450